MINMNQHKLSALWSFVFAAMMLLLGNSAVVAQQVLGVNSSGVAVYSGATCDGPSVQSAVNAAGAGGEVRFQINTCTISTSVTVSNSMFWRTGGGVVTLVISGGATVNIQNGATLTIDQRNGIDIVIANGTLRIEKQGATISTLALTSEGTTIGVGATGTFENNGNFVTSGSPRTTGVATRWVAGTTTSTIDAPAGVYYTGAGRIGGGGTFGNIYTYANWVPNDAATGNALTGTSLATGASSTQITLAVNDGNKVGVGQTLLLGANIRRITAVLGDQITFTPAIVGTTSSTAYTIVGHVMNADAEVVATAGNFDLGAIRQYSLNSASAGSFDFQIGTATFTMGTATSTFFTDADNFFNGLVAAGGSTVSATHNVTLGELVTYGGANQFGASQIAGNFTVASAAGITATTSNTLTLSVQGNVEVNDAEFNQSIVMTNLGSSATTSNLTLGTAANPTAFDLAVTPTSNTNKTVNFAPTAARTLATLTLNASGTGRGIMNTSGAGAITITQLGSVAGTLNVANTVGVASSTGTTASGTISITDAAAAALTFTQTAPSVFNNQGTISRAGRNGSFTFSGDLANAGSILGGTGGTTLNASLAAEVNSSYVSNLVAASTADNIRVNGVFVNNVAASSSNWTGNIYIGDAGTLSGTFTYGSVNFIGTATQTQSRSFQGATVVRSGIFDNTAGVNATRVLTQLGATTASQPSNTAPNGGVFMGENARWVDNGIQFNAAGTNGTMSFGQVTAALQNGRMLVGTTTATTVQLVSNVWVQNAVLNPAGTVIRREIGPACFTFNSAGSISGNGVVLNCGVFTITSNTPSIRAQLIAAGYNPDAVSVSVEVALATGTTEINLTDGGVATQSGSEPLALEAAGVNAGRNWRGVTISNTQRNFVLRRGIVNLNSANLNLHGGLVFSGDGADGSRIQSTFTPQSTLELETANFNDRGYVVFTNNTFGGAAPQSNIKFERDGVNHLNVFPFSADNFTIERLRISRNSSTQVDLIDANQENGVPSTLVIRERFEVLNGTIFNINDNNLRYIGGNKGMTTVSTTLTSATVRNAYRKIEIFTSNFQGTGYLDLGNDNISADDRNRITVAGLSGGTLRSQLRQTGTAGDRNLTGVTSIANSITGFTTIGNQGITHIMRGSLNLGSVTTITDVETFVSGPSFVQGAGVTFRGNLYLSENDNPKSSTTSRLQLTGTNVVLGNLTLHNLGQTTLTTGSSPNALALSGGTGLSVEGDITFLSTTTDAEPVQITRPARLTVGGSSNLPATITLSGSADRYVQRLQINRPGGAQFQAALNAAADLFVNDLLLTNGTFFTGGNLAMYDLTTPGALLGAGNADPNYVTSDATTAVTSFQGLNNLSIVTRDRTSAVVHGQISRNTNNGTPAGPFGAYISASYNAAGGAPYTVQHVGSASRYSGDELPGLVVVNGRNSDGTALSTNSTVNRLVIDLNSNSVELELTKDLVVNNRLETLTGKLDIAQTAFLDINHGMQWVLGHMALSTDLDPAVSIRFPNTTGNARSIASTSLANGKYDILYVSQQDVTTGYEFQSPSGPSSVRDLTIITSGTGTKAAPITITLNENKSIYGSLRIVDGNLNLNNRTLQVLENVIVDGNFNAVGSTMNANQNGNARVSGWFPTRASSETSAAGTSLNRYDYGVGNYDNGYGKVVADNGTIEMTSRTADLNTATFGGPIKDVSAYILGYVQDGTATTDRHFYLPNIVVNKPIDANVDARSVTFEIDQSFTEGFDQSAFNRISVLSFTQTAGHTILRPGNVLNADMTVRTSAAAAFASGFERYSSWYASGSPTATNNDLALPLTQLWESRGNTTITSGRFDSFGANMLVGNDFTLGDEGVATTWALFNGGSGNALVTAGDWPTTSPFSRVIASDSHTNNMTSLTLSVVRNFRVHLDKAANVRPNEGTQRNVTPLLMVQASGEASPDQNIANANIHRFLLAGGRLAVAGNYTFEGHADVTSGILQAPRARGLRGTVIFNGTSVQEVKHVQVTGAQPAAYKHADQFGRAFFNNVEVIGAGIKVVGTDQHLYVNDSGKFTFTLGNVDTGSNELVLFNKNGTDTWNGSLIGSNAIAKSGANSFVIGKVRRFMESGSQSGGIVNNGYIFPLGYATTNNRYWRPLTVQFPQNLGQTLSLVASTEAVTDTTMNDLKVEGRNGDLTLNSVSDAKWNMTFEELPSIEPNVRLGVQGLVSNPRAVVDNMRIVTSEGGKFRMAGVYDMDNTGAPDDLSYSENQWVDGVPTFTQEGVRFSGPAVQYNGNYSMDLRIATTCPGNCFRGNLAYARVQVIHNSPAGSADVKVNGVTVLDDLAYQTAKNILAPANTPLTVQVTTANGATTLATVNIAGLDAAKNYILIAQGGADGKDFTVKDIADARTTSTVAGAMQMIFSHGVTNGPSVTVERVSSSTPRTTEQLVAVNAAFGSVTGYTTFANPGIATYQIKAGSAVAGQFLFNNLGDFTGKAVTMLATGKVGGSGLNALNLMVVDADGNVTKAAITTSDEDTNVELPTEFALHGNFPNPFNPTTNIRFDLPEQANVRVEIVDLLGRSVMTLAPQAMSAGANKVITVDAARLSSGVYFYRVVAEGASRTFVQGSKFTLLK